jgi:alpha-glucosidase
LLLLALPGPTFVYQGDELGLPEVDVPDEALQDPIWERSGHTIRGRDGCRVPLPWRGTNPPYGFSTGASTWLPMPADWADLCVERQEGDVTSMLALYRTALRLRRTESAFGGADLAWQPSVDTVLDFVRAHPGSAVRCVVNLGSEPIALPAGEVLLASAPVRDGRLPADTAVWLRTGESAA